MKIAPTKWKAYTASLAMINSRAAREMLAFAGKNGLDDRKKLMDYGMALVQKYGEGSAELACEMYDAIARLQKASVPAAKPADIPDYGEVAMSVNGTLKQSPDGKLLGDAVSRLVKQVGADTMLKNARRDHAEFAWIPSGDACPFCAMIASNGWQRATRQTVSGDHAEHIHANCQCEFAIRFTSELDVSGYEPEKLREEWDNAEGTTQAEKLNFMRREKAAEDKYFKNAHFKSPISSSDMEWLESVGGMGTSADITPEDRNYVERNIHNVSSKENIGKVVQLSSMDYVYAVELKDFLDYNILWKIPNDDNLNDAVAKIKGRRR